MTPSDSVLDELRGLLDALCEQSITVEQIERLESLILAHPAAEAYYVQYMSLYADLSRHFTVPGGRADQSPSFQTTASHSTPELASPTATHSDARSPRSRRRWWLAGSVVGLTGLAAILLMNWGQLAPLSVPGSMNNPDSAIEAIDNTVAVLLRTHRAEWEETGMPTRSGAPLPPGRLVLRSGSAHLEFYSGATVILEGPAELRLISRTEAFCVRGKLRASVPPPAQGFAIGTPALNLIDKGTEFGLEVVGGKSNVHVFLGQVDVFDPGANEKTDSKTELTTGQGVSRDGPGAVTRITSDPAAFLTAQELATRSARDMAVRQKEWAAASAELRRDPSLVVYYPFDGDAAISRTLSDAAGAGANRHDGAIVGCTAGAGRWAGRKGLEFKRVSDRVLLNVPGEFESLTLSAWVRPDALPNKNNSLFMADGWEPGEFHWQIGNNGTVILGVQQDPKGTGAHYHAPGVMTAERFGRWVHLAVVYDRDAGLVTHYVDGRPAAEQPIAFDVPLRVGDAQIGNWNVATHRNSTPIRNFNGGIDEFQLFSRALTALEIERLYVQGRPPL